VVQQRYRVYALDLPGMGYSEIAPGASYQEPAMRAAVKRLLTQLDLRDPQGRGGGAAGCAGPPAQRERVIVPKSPGGPHPSSPPTATSWLIVDDEVDAALPEQQDVLGAVLGDKRIRKGPSWYQSTWTPAFFTRRA
jgi:pimeloyl-ACP methyl ester carboxylesterase